MSPIPGRSPAGAALATLGLLTLGLAAAPAAQANLLVNGSFESPVVGTASYLDITVGNEPAGFGWVVTTNGVDVFSVGVLGQNASVVDGVQALDLVGLGGTGGLAQTFASVLGQHYTLSFAYANNPISTVEAAASVAIGDGTTTLWSGDITHSGSTAGNLAWTPYSADFVGNGQPLTLNFLTTEGGNNGGVFIDAVTIEPSAPVPEPRTLALLLGGMVGMAGFVHRRRRAVQE